MNNGNTFAPAHHHPVARAARWLTLCVSLWLASPAGGAANPWAEVKAASPGMPEAIGLSTAGCVKGAETLPLDSDGYHVMKPSRNRYYGHPELVRFIETLGRQVVQHHLGVMLVGDLGQPRGGPTLSMHRSHQSGLDVDIWFWLPPALRSRPLTPAQREGWSAPSMLAPDGESLDRVLWTPAHVELLRLAARQDKVDRIFVHPAIKRELCARERDHSWLDKIRPWWGHDDHFHVRLRCPAGDRQCIPQEPLPAGDGCDASLAWWFSDEAKRKATLRSTEPPLPPKLPAACMALIGAPSQARSAWREHARGLRPLGRTGPVDSPLTGSPARPRPD